MTTKFVQFKTSVLKLVERLPDPSEYIKKEMSNVKNITNSEFLKKSLPILFMLLADATYHKDVSSLLETLKSADPKHVLEAFVGAHRKNEKTVKIPTSLNELRSIIQEAANGRQKIKAISTKYSRLWTDIGGSKEIIIDTSSLTASSPDIECLKKDLEDPEQYYSFEAGITMRAIQEVLWPSISRTTEFPQEHRVLENATAGAALSLAGTVTTGAHGNGLRTGIVADAVASFQMFTIDSEWKIKRYQIEPSNGITDPEKFEKKHLLDEDNFELIQKDDVFNATVVNIGCMGVVYSYVIRTVPGYYMEETRKVYTWIEAQVHIKKYFESGLNFQVIGSPYKYKINPFEDKEEYRVLISVLEKTESHDAGHRPAGQTLLPMQFLDKALVAAGDSTPHVIPLVMHFSLMYLEHEKVVLNAVEALNTLSGIVEEEFSDVRTSECAIISEDSHTIIKVMDHLHKLYDKIRTENNRQLVNVPIALRITDTSQKFMAMGYDGKKHRKTITIEQSIINGTLGADDTLKQFREEMFRKFNGRPHWGMLHDMDSKKLTHLYSETYEKFCSALNDFDPNFVFENEFADWVFGKARRIEKQRNTNDVSTEEAAELEICISSPEKKPCSLISGRIPRLY